MVKSLQVISLLFVLLSQTFAQDIQSSFQGVIRGKLLDGSTQQPLIGANILIYSSKDSVLITGGTTDKSGNFNIGALPLDTYNFEIQYIGYGSQILENLVTSNAPLNLGTINLQQTPIDVEEIVATASAPEIRFEPGKTVISVSDSAAVEGESAADLLENAPGVTFDEDETVAIRGQKASIYIDGVKTNLEDVLSQIPAGSIESIEVIPNPSAKYESSAGGVIDIKLKKHKKKGSNGRIRFGYHDSGDYQIFANGSLNIKGINAFAEFSDRLFTRISNTEYWRETYSENPWYLDLSSMNNRSSRTRQYRVGTRLMLSPNQTFNLSYHNNRRLKGKSGFTVSDRLDSTSALQRFVEKDKASTENRELNEIALVYNFDDRKSRSNLNILIALSQTGSIRNEEDQKQNFDINGFPSGYPDSDSLYSDDNRDQTTVKIDWSLPDIYQHEIDLGYHYRLDDNMLQNDYHSFMIDEGIWELDDPRGGAFLLNETMHGGYINYNYTGETYLFNIGTRIESISNQSVHSDTGLVNHKYEQLLPSVQLVRMISPLKILQFSYSRRITPPAYNRLNPQVINTSTYFLRTGNPYLKPEQIDSYELQYIWNNEKHNVSSSLFFKEIDDIIGNQIEIIADSITHVFPDNLSGGEAFGVDINWVYKPAAGLKITTSLVHFNSMLMSHGDDTFTKREKITTSAKIKLDLKWSKRYSLRIIHKYESPRITWQGSHAAKQFTDMSFKAFLWNRSVSLNLKVSDVFNSRIDEKEIDYRSEFFARQITEYDSQRFILTLSYSFNNQWKKHERK